MPAFLAAPTRHLSAQRPPGTKKAAPEGTAEGKEEPAPADEGGPGTEGPVDRLAELSAQVSALSDQLAAMEGLLDSRTVPQSVFQHFNTTISAQLDRVKLSLTADILKEVIKFREDMARFSANAHAKRDEITVDSLLSSIDNFDCGLLNILEGRGVSCGRPEVGTPFDSRTQKIVPPVVPTDDRELDRKVESVRTDYYELEGKVIYPSQVKVYKFNEE